MPISQAGRLEGKFQCPSYSVRHPNERRENANFFLLYSEMEQRKPVLKPSVGRLLSSLWGWFLSLNFNFESAKKRKKISNSIMQISLTFSLSKPFGVPISSLRIFLLLLLVVSKSGIFPSSSLFAQRRNLCQLSPNKKRQSPIKTCSELRKFREVM